MTDQVKTEEKNTRNNGGVFVPAGIFLGLGIGYLVNNVPAGFFIGLGCGFVAFAIISLKK